MKTKQIVPQVGMGATLLSGSDSYAYTIVSVETNKGGKVVRIGATMDKAKRTDKNGMSEAQSYKYTTDKTATVVYFTLRRNGLWIDESRQVNRASSSFCLEIGERRSHCDFSF